MERSEERNQFLDDVIEGALYGCAYWASGRRKEGKQEIWDHDEPEKIYVLDRDLVAKGISKVLDADFKVRKDIRANIYLGNLENDCCDIDAECADVIVQAALFDQIVFG